MTIRTSIIGDAGLGDGSKREVDVHRIDTVHGNHSALVTLSQDLIRGEVDARNRCSTVDRNYFSRV